MQPTQPMTPETLANAFTPLYSYQMPAWWQTPYGALVVMVGGVLLVLLVCYGAWYWWWYKPPLTLAQWRERELTAIACILEQEQVDYKRFFGAATFFLKQYMLRLYGWQVLDKTDDELMVFVAAQKQVPKKMHQQIADVLSYAQMVKFADQAALAEKAEETMSCVREVVAQLKPVLEKK